MFQITSCFSLNCLVSGHKTKGTPINDVTQILRCIDPPSPFHAKMNGLPIKCHKSVNPPPPMYVTSFVHDLLCVCTYLISNSWNFVVDTSPGRRHHRLRTSGAERSKTFGITKRRSDKVSLTLFQIVDNAL